VKNSFVLSVSIFLLLVLVIFVSSNVSNEMPESSGAVIETDSEVLNSVENQEETAYTTNTIEDNMKNHTVNYTKYESIVSKDGFATMVLGNNITRNNRSLEYIRSYEARKAGYKDVSGIEIVTLRNGFHYNDVVGVEVAGHKYILDLQYCNTKECEITITGVDTGMVPATRNSPQISLIRDHSIEILSIKKKCDYEICHPVYDMYDEVRVAVR